MNYIFTKKKINNPATLVFLLTISVLLSTNLIYSQSNENKQKAPDPSLHNEIMEDEYVPDLRESQERSPAYNYSMRNITTVQVNVDANGLNIIGDAANEPSIAVDPNNRSRMAIGWRQFNTINSNFRQAGYAYTTDDGATWTFPGVIQPGVFRSDPVLDVDADGNFYYNSLATSPTFLTDVFKSSTGGSSWDGGTFAQGGDKQWMAIDKSGGMGDGHIYAFWTVFYSVCEPGHFTRSTNAGISFEDCIAVTNNPYWGTLTVGADGVLYLGGSIGNDFLVAKSSNAQNSSQVVSWDMATVVSLDGTITFGGAPNPGGLMGQANIAVDTSGGPYHGNVYLLCTVNRNSINDPADIMFARSTDGGVSWSSPIRINDDVGTSAYQWFGTMSVAPTGRIDVVWLDTRNNPSSTSALYYSNSHDGGVTWSQNVRISDHFNSLVGWPNQNKMGDYFDMVSDIDGARLAWAATFNGGQDVYYSYIFGDIVPVELTSFTASSVSDVVILNWSTATEINNYGFEIERSSDGSNWRLTGFREGNGTTSEPQNYFYADKLSRTEYSKLYYRLKQIDFDGSYEYSKIIEVEIAPFEFLLSQNYPNPFNPTTKISWQSPVSGWQTLKVYDILGNEVATLLDEFRSAGRYEVELDASGLSSGMYFYQLRAGDFNETRKMMLTK
jgi:hypothetical protein